MRVCVCAGARARARVFFSILVCSFGKAGVSRKWSSQYKAGKSVSWALKCEGRELCEAKSVGIEAGIRAGYQQQQQHQQQRQQQQGADSGPVTVEKETSAAMFVDASHQIAFNPSRVYAFFSGFLLPCCVPIRCAIDVGFTY